MDDNEIVADWPTTFGICCCCLSEGEYKDMMEEYVWIGEKEVYADMLQQCFDLIMMTIPEDDSKRLICEICVTRLRDASRFRIQVEDAQINYIDRMSTFRLSQTQQKQSTELKVEFDWQGGDSDDNYFDDPNFSHFKKTPDEDLDGEVDDKELVTKEVKKKAIKRKATKSKLKEVELTEEDIKAERGHAVVECYVTGRFPANSTFDVKKMLTNKKRDDTAAIEILRDKDETGIEWVKWERTAKHNRILRNMDIILEYTDLCPFMVNKGMFRCVVCAECFGDLILLKNHFSKHEIRQSIRKITGLPLKMQISNPKCLQCNINMEKFHNVRVHLRKVHNKTLDNDFCEEILFFDIKDNLICCLVCERGFEHFHSLNLHMNQHNTEFMCDTCGLTFASAKRLHAHERKHLTGTFSCSRCDMVFENELKKRTHTLMVHRGGLGHRCSYCKERFKSMYAKSKHMSQTHGKVLQKYACKYCSQSFGRSGTRSSHVRKVHLLERNYKCERCDLSFFSKSQLTHHLPKHGSMESFQCEFCDRSYVRIKTMKAHQKTHHSKPINDM